MVNRIISEVVEEVMLSIFGRRGFESILRVMKEKYNLDLDGIPSNPQVFSKALREIIGVGSIIVEDLIVENLYMKVGLELRWRKGYRFPDYINDIKNSIQLNTRKALG
ncbi:hypothetical protein KEJ17_00480 [Candidatus Bathyarchaeota archaeon]|nr:hypothetical protein [Candidatus Bathyarchaeota archaeon]